MGNAIKSFCGKLLASNSTTAAGKVYLRFELSISQRNGSACHIKPSCSALHTLDRKAATAATGTAKRAMPQATELYNWAGLLLGRGDCCRLLGVSTSMPRGDFSSSMSRLCRFFAVSISTLRYSCACFVLFTSAARDFLSSWAALTCPYMHDNALAPASKK